MMTKANHNTNPVRVRYSEPLRCEPLHSEPLPHHHLYDKHHPSSADVSPLRWLLLGLLLCLFALPITAQQEDTPVLDEPEEVVFRAVVDVESGFVRATPEFDGEPVASIYDNEILEVVSRNLDGQWFEVRRPYRMSTLGWVFQNVLEWDFAVEYLPLGDVSTGVEGPDPLTQRPEYGVFMQEGAALRSAPSRRGEILRNLPPLIVIPVIGRNQDGSWLKVNYVGYEGWVITFTTRRRPDIMNFPEVAGLPPLDVPTVPIIPPEVQRAELNRLRDYINERRVVAQGLESFWWKVFRGEVMPCDAPPEITAYEYTVQNVRELPELLRELPRLDQAVNSMNGAIDVLNRCGVVSPEDVIRARNQSINARIIFDAALERLEILEELIR